MKKNIDDPMWKELAMAVINRGAMDYILALMKINGAHVPKTAMNRPVLNQSTAILDDCETFFFSGWFRLLSSNTGLDGMMLATAIESDWQDMYERMKKARSGRPIGDFSDWAAERREKERIRGRLRYQQNKEKIAQRRREKMKLRSSAE